MRQTSIDATAEPAHSLSESSGRVPGESPDTAVTDGPVPLVKDQLPIGSPLEVRIIDVDGTVLLDVGAVIPCSADRDFLFTRFQPHRDVATAGEVSAPIDPKRTRSEPANGIGAMGLAVGARLGVRFPLGGVRTTHASRLIGYAPNEAIFITPPASDARRLDVSPGKVVEVVGVSSRAVYLFTCSVEAVYARPFPYVILSKPGVIRRVRERRTERIKTRLAVLFNTVGDEGEVSGGLGISNDISDLGMALATSRMIGVVGDRIHMVFYLDMDSRTVCIDTHGWIRNVKTLNPLPSAELMYEYGLEYEELSAEDRFALRSFVLSHKRLR